MQAGHLTMLEVLTVDFRTGQMEPHQVSFSRVDPTVFDLKNELLEVFPQTEIRVKNQSLLLEEQERLSQLMEADAQLTALVMERMVRGIDEPDEKRAPVVNKTGGMVVIEDKKTNGLIFLGPDEISNDLKLEKMWIHTSKTFHVFRYKTESCCMLCVILLYCQGQVRAQPRRRSTAEGGEGWRDSVLLLQLRPSQGESSQTGSYPSTSPD